MQPEDRLARRNALVLALAQALGGALTSITIALGGLVGVTLLGQSTHLATLPVSLMIVGTACGTIPAAMLMGRVGRRAGFMTGALTASIGGFIAFTAIMTGLFPLYCVGTFFGGFSFAFVQQYRFAAAEGATPGFRPKAISYVLAGGLLAGIIGPQTVIATRDLFAPTAFAGAYLAQAVLALFSIAVLAFYRGPLRAPESAEAAAGRPLRQILAEPKVQLAILVAVVSYGVMSLMMTAAPLAMLGCGFGTDDAAFGIQWHVIAMFAPSFFTGNLISRYGAEIIATIGLALLAFAGATALMGLELFHFYGALILLGLGWNFGFIGGTAMLTQAQRPEERARTQAANDFIVFGMVALASLSSGVLFQTAGWSPINWVLLGLVACPLVVMGIAGYVSQIRQADKLA
ncbi:MFS transporter [Acuticoccus sediminis]|uniref:MFS transporter n=1 Tax=Acuticoccus sediminis TaxID=2184697 RepID=A0A8B2NL49_9HYPH|nr:MFS transporter [Acuticoccus sediminis]RAH96976.1 MFS transporter [Acuticoccus sediminis]